MTLYSQFLFIFLYVLTEELVSDIKTSILSYYLLQDQDIAIGEFKANALTTSCYKNPIKIIKIPHGHGRQSSWIFKEAAHTHAPRRHSPIQYLWLLFQIQLSDSDGDEIVILILLYFLQNILLFILIAVSITIVLYFIFVMLQ